VAKGWYERQVELFSMGQEAINRDKLDVSGPGNGEELTQTEREALRRKV
jgi:hypothetical protein